MPDAVSFGRLGSTVVSLKSVREQYERFPYPPVPRFALPRPGQGEVLSYERGTELTLGKSKEHRGIRILVAGCGTLEAAVIAQTHPDADEIVAVDLSAKSIFLLKQRLFLGLFRARLTSPFRRFPTVLAVCTDLHEWEPVNQFDYIIASNVLHHVPDPAALLKRLSSWLKPQGILRMVTYPKGSRFWMRQTAQWLRARGLDAGDPRLVAKARTAIRTLPESDPIRSCFESQPETKARAGIVDAFFNVCENPLSPIEWKSATTRAGLVLAAEDQTASSRSSFLDELFPSRASLGNLDRWEKLQILDDLWELCANPILWLRKGTDEMPEIEETRDEKIAISDALPEMVAQIRSAERLLKKAGIPLSEMIEVLRREVGPRVSAPPEQRVLPGLSITEYPL